MSKAFYNYLESAEISFNKLDFLIFQCYMSIIEFQSFWKIFQVTSWQVNDFDKNCNFCLKK